LHDLLVSRVVHTCENRELLKICFEEGDELRRRLFEDVATSTLESHLAAHPQVEPAMSPKVFVDMCLAAVNWTYRWFRPTGPRWAHQN
jgi:hypothetical protein